MCRFIFCLPSATRQCVSRRETRPTACRTDREEAHISRLWDTGKNPGSTRTHTFAVACKIVEETAIFEKARYYNGFPIYSGAFKGLCDFCRCELAVVEALHVPWLSYTVRPSNNIFSGLMVGNSLKIPRKACFAFSSEKSPLASTLRSPDSKCMFCCMLMFSRRVESGSKQNLVLEQRKDTPVHVTYDRPFLPGLRERRRRKPHTV